MRRDVRGERRKDLIGGDEESDGCWRKRRREGGIRGGERGMLEEEKERRRDVRGGEGGILEEEERERDVSRGKRGMLAEERERDVSRGKREGC
jgi:hypothetical protein